MKKTSRIILVLLLVLTLFVSAQASADGGTISQRYSISDVRREFGLGEEFVLVGATNDSYTFKKVGEDETEVHVVSCFKFQEVGTASTTQSRDELPWDPFYTEVLADIFYQYGTISASNMTLTRPTKVGIRVSSFSSNVAAIAVGYAIKGSVYEVQNNVAVLTSQNGSVKVQVTYNNPVAGGEKYASNYNTVRGIGGATTGEMYMQLKYTDGTTSVVKTHRAES